MKRILAGLVAVFVCCVFRGQAAVPHLRIKVEHGANLEQIVKDVPPQSQATIEVGPGTYRAHNLWKPGVNFEGSPGAELVWDATGTQDGAGIWDDRGKGAGTNWIYWPGKVSYTSDTDVDVSPGNGMLVLTNADSVVYGWFGAIYTEFTDQRVFGSGDFVIINCRLAVLHVEYSYEDLNGSFGNSYGSLCYWENGDTQLTFGRAIHDDGYLLWFQEPTGSPASDIYVTGQYGENSVGVGNPNGIRFTGTNKNWRAWVTMDELSNLNAGGATIGMDGEGGKLYCKIKKLGQAINSPTTAGAAIINKGGELWYEGDKVSSTGNFFQGRSNSLSHITVRDWDDFGTNVQAGFVLEGGQHNFYGGRAKVWNGKGIVHTGGTNRFSGMTIDTFGTNTLAAGATNCFPLVMGSGASNLVLQTVALRGPIATVGGGSLSIWGSNAAAHVLAYGPVICNSNAAAVHGIITALITNQTQMK